MVNVIRRLPMNDPSEPVDNIEEPGNLRFLRLLVTILTGVMIAGVVVVVALLVTRLSGDTPQVPDDLTLPEGVEPQAVTFGDGWIAVVTTDQRIVIFDRTTGKIRQTVTLD